MLVAQCPSCKRLHPAPKTIDGKKVKCKDCGHQFTAKVVSSEEFQTRPGTKQAPAAAPASVPSKPKKEEAAPEEEIVAQPIEDGSQPYVGFPRSSADESSSPASKPVDPAQVTSVKCPHCNFCHDVPRAAIGKTVTCPSCQNDFLARIQLDDISPEMLASIPTGLAAVADTDDSLSAPVASTGSIQKELSGYKAFNTIGAGESSTIWQVRKDEMGDVLALKQVVKKSGREFAIDQAENEFELGSQFNHANIRRILEIHRIRQLLFTKEIHLVMEYCPGKSLKDYTPGTLVSILNVFLQAAKGLQYIHEQGYVHADICPEHIISSPEGQVKIIGLGECCKMLTVKSKPDELIQFGSPELMLSRPIDKRADIYSLGAVLFWTLTGERPTFSEKERKETLEKQLANQSAGIRNLIISCIEINPTERIGDMADVIKKLESLG